MSDYDTVVAQVSGFQWVKFSDKIREDLLRRHVPELFDPSVDKAWYRVSRDFARLHDLPMKADAQ